MNAARQLYLALYYKIDLIDHMIKNCCMTYINHKYWHSPMIHGKCLVIVIVYDLYLEVAEGKFSEIWRCDDPMPVWEFREQLSIQLLRYKPTNCPYK
eukprot:11024468-Ditylum_brightwellii.AAC.1